jgi:hypothetical protein
MAGRLGSVESSVSVAESFTAKTAVADARVTTEVAAAKEGEAGISGSVPGGISKQTIIDQLTGKSAQADQIAAAIQRGDITVSILGDGLFNRMLGGSQALARGSKIYLRSSSPRIFSEAVHEGTHSLDFINGFGSANPVSRLVWEKRAWFYERQFQIAAGEIPEFSTLEQMLLHINSAYKDEIFNPYPILNP